MSRTGFPQGSAHGTVRSAERAYAFFHGIRKWPSPRISGRILIAVVRIQGKPGNLPVLPYGDSDSLQIGEWVVGVNTPIYSRTGGYQGIGFAIPVNLPAGWPRNSSNPERWCAFGWAFPFKPCVRP